MPTVTGLRAVPRNRVAVELDGVPWRVLPVDVVAGAGLSEGRLLDRETVRTLRRELRRVEALRVAGRALRSRDLSRRRLGERLERAAVTPPAARQTLETLERAGVVDDDRVCRLRAEALAERAYGNEAILHRLVEEGFDPATVTPAVAALEPETARAAKVVARRGTGPRTARYLAARGFGEDAVGAALGQDA